MYVVQMKDNIRFSVICRTIEEKAREQILHGERVKVQRRLAGQKFVTTSDTVRDFMDNAEPRLVRS
jgi:hypothetical protein